MHSTDLTWDQFLMHEVVLDVDVLAVHVMSWIIYVIDRSLIIDIDHSQSGVQEAGSVLNQIAECNERLVAMYSASILNKATVGCFFDVQATAPPTTRNVFPEIDFWSFGLLP